MGRARFVILSAMALLAVGTIEFLVFFGYQGYWPNTSRDFQELWPWYVATVLPLPVAAAISARICIVDPRFHQGAQWAATIRLCVITYLVYAPFFGAGLGLTPDFREWRTFVFVFGFPLIVAFTVIPFLWVEYMIVGISRTPSKGQWPSSSAT